MITRIFSRLLVAGFLFPTALLAQSVARAPLTPSNELERLRWIVKQQPQFDSALDPFLIKDKVPADQLREAVPQAIQQDILNDSECSYKFDTDADTLPVDHHTKEPILPHYMYQRFLPDLVDNRVFWMVPCKPEGRYITFKVYMAQTRDGQTTVTPIRFASLESDYDVRSLSGVDRLYANYYHEAVMTSAALIQVRAITGNATAPHRVHTYQLIGEGGVYAGSARSALLSVMEQDFSNGAQGGNDSWRYILQQPVP